jgi:predicted TIM-barrel fold metal-dependent hydrolase
MPGVIDFRLRPTAIEAVEHDFVREILRKMKVKGTESFEKLSQDLLLEEMDAAGIAIGVIGSRTGTVKPGFASTSNEDIANFVADHSGRFIGFGVIDSSDPAAACDELDRVIELGLVGITIEPSQVAVRMKLDDKRLYPIYEKAQAKNLAVFTAMSCLVGPYLDDTRIELLDHVATDFPDLTVVIQHAGWPYVREAIGLAYKRRNVNLVPSQYVHYGFPGAQDIVDAANGILEDQILYGSVYPVCGPFTELMKIVDNLGFTDRAKEKYLGGNARRILGLSK